MTAKKSTHGGARSAALMGNRNAAKPANQHAKPRSLRLSDADWAKLARLAAATGATDRSDYIRRHIDNA